jgi:hypothetical protein
LALLPLTLGLKLAVRPGGSSEPEEGDRSAQLKVAEFLVRQHFAVAMSQQATQGRPTIQAIAGPCRMLVAESSVIGSDRDLFSRNVTAADRVFFVWRGKVYQNPPRWLTVPQSLWARFRRELGLEVQTAALLGIIAAQNCEY